MAGSPSYRRPRSFAGKLGIATLGIFAGALAALQYAPTPGAQAAVGRAREVPVAHDRLTADFVLCHRGGGTNCVVDGDTFWFAGEKIRIADIDTPETHPARCPDEQRLGDAATLRLHQWLNAGAFSLEAADRDTDRYGRLLRVVTRDGTSVGSLLVAEGLARRWTGHRTPWC